MATFNSELTESPFSRFYVAAQPYMALAHEHLPFAWTVVKAHPVLSGCALTFVGAMVVPLVVFALFAACSVSVTLTFSLAAFVIVEGSILATGLCMLFGGILFAGGIAVAISIGLLLTALYVKGLFVAGQLVIVSYNTLIALSETPISVAENGGSKNGKGENGSSKKENTTLSMKNLDGAGRQTRSVTFNEQVDSCLISTIDESWKNLGSLDKVANVSQEIANEGGDFCVKNGCACGNGGEEGGEEEGEKQVGMVGGGEGMKAGMWVSEEGKVVGLGLNAKEIGIDAMVAATNEAGTGA